MEKNEVLRMMREKLEFRNYSSKTIKSYLYIAEDYLDAYPSKQYIREDDIRSYILSKKDKGLAPKTLHVYLNGVFFMLKHIYGQEKPPGMRFPKKTLTLPTVLSRKEISLLLSMVTNRKHKLLLALAYGAGLRVSEVTKLRIQDIDVEEMILYIRQGKGNKDRISILPEKFLNQLGTLAAMNPGKQFLFPSERGGRLTERSAQKIFKTALKRSGIKKSATFHSLRHSFATHLLENGTDVRYVQELLGHQNIRTTQRYTQVTNPKLKHIRSPLQ